MAIFRTSTGFEHLHLVACLGAERHVSLSLYVYARERTYAYVRACVRTCLAGFCTPSCLQANQADLPPVAQARWLDSSNCDDYCRRRNCLVRRNTECLQQASSSCLEQLADLKGLSCVVAKAVPTQ
eukprot:1665479-Amphidinium_carterae.1